jgi:hypothetical protein
MVTLAETVPMPPPAEPPAIEAAPGRPASTPRRRLPQRRMALLVVAGLAGATTAVSWAVLGSHESTTGPASHPATAVAVDAASVRADASSTQVDDGTIGYGPENTLDGDPSTAWNSNGARDGKGQGLRLDYTFSSGLDLRTVTIRNGYQKVRERPGRPAVDLYPLNGRLRRVTVVTDAGRWTWDLADGRAPQTLAVPGRTRSLRLEVRSVYASTTYPDLAVSEVSFTATP